MREVVMTREEFKQIPGYSTRLSVARIKGMVDALLTEHGVQVKAWITRGGEDELLFQMDVEIQGVVKKIAYQFRPPIIVVKKRSSKGPNTAFPTNAPGRLMTSAKSTLTTTSQCLVATGIPNARDAVPCPSIPP